MSETVKYKCKVSYLCEATETNAMEILGGLLETYYSTYLEKLRDKDDKYVIIDNDIYVVEHLKRYDPNDDYFYAIKKVHSYEVDVQFCEEGCSLSEAISEAVTNVQRTDKN